MRRGVHREHREVRKKRGENKGHRKRGKAGVKMENNLLMQSLSKYRDISIKLIECVEREDYNFLENLLNERQRVIETVDEIDHTKEEFTKICSDLNILIFQKKLDELMNEKRSKVKRELEALNENKNARKNYSRTYAMDFMVFNKKI